MSRIMPVTQIRRSDKYLFSVVVCLWRLFSSRCNQRKKKRAVCGWKKNIKKTGSVHWHYQWTNWNAPKNKKTKNHWVTELEITAADDRNTVRVLYIYTSYFLEMPPKSRADEAPHQLQTFPIVRWCSWLDDESSQNSASCIRNLILSVMIRVSWPKTMVRI